MITGNEPAMPTIEQTGNPQCWNTVAGITIRQHFAAMAMQGLIASTDWNETVATEGHIKHTTELAVIYSDQLIESLNKS